MTVVAGLLVIEQTKKEVYFSQLKTMLTLPKVFFPPTKLMYISKVTLEACICKIQTNRVQVVLILLDKVQ